MLWLNRRRIYEPPLLCTLVQIMANRYLLLDLWSKRVWDHIGTKIFICLATPDNQSFYPEFSCRTSSVLTILQASPAATESSPTSSFHISVSDHSIQRVPSWTYWPSLAACFLPQLVWYLCNDINAEHTFLLGVATLCAGGCHLCFVSRRVAVISFSVVLKSVDKHSLGYTQVTLTK